MSTGPSGRTYDKIGQALQAALANTHSSVSLRLLPSDGACQNVQRLLGGDAQLALTQCNILYAAYGGDGQFASPHHELRMISMLHQEAVQIVARRNAGITGVSDLRGKRVAFDSYHNGWLVFEAHGFFETDLEIVPTDVGEMPGALRRGEVDAFVVVGGVPHPPVREALEDDCVLLPVPSASDGTRISEMVQKFVRLRTFLHQEDLDLSQYGGRGAIPSITIDAALVCTSGFDDAVGHALAKALATSPQTIADAHPALRGYAFRRTSEWSPIPMQAGALRGMLKTGAASYPVRVYAGMYLYSISELNLSEGTYLLDGYIWFRWMGPLLDEEDFEFEVTNGQLERIDDAPIRRENGWNRQSRRCTIRARGDFLLYDYPFDTQVLTLSIEHRYLGTQKLVFEPDEVTTSSDLAVSDWVVDDVTHEAVSKAYESGFGVIDTDWSGTSSRYVVKAVLRRRITPYLVKTVIPLTIIVAMSFLVFFIPAKDFKSQPAIVVTALLSCVALHIAQASALPEVGYLVTADKFFLLAYVVVFLALVETVVANNLYTSGRESQGARLDRISYMVFPLLFLVPVGYLVVSALW